MIITFLSFLSDRCETVNKRNQNFLFCFTGHLNLLAGGRAAQSGWRTSEIQRCAQEAREHRIVEARTRALWCKFGAELFLLVIVVDRKK